MLRVNANGVTQNSGGGVNRAFVTRHFSNAAGIAITSLEAMPPLMIQLFQQPNQLLKEGEDPVVPSFLYVTKRVADALLNANVDSAKIGALGATKVPLINGIGGSAGVNVSVVTLRQGAKP